MHLEGVFVRDQILTIFQKKKINSSICGAKKGERYECDIVLKEVLWIPWGIDVLYIERSFKFKILSHKNLENSL